FLACEASIIPSVFNYTTGEAIELGRALRLPNTALRRKLELEQPDGCAWSGCGRPVQWTEAHHIRHWADGGPTVAANLILLCRLPHGRLHPPGWTISALPGAVLVMVQARVWRRPHCRCEPDLAVPLPPRTPPHPRLDHHQNRTRQSTDRPPRRPRQHR